MVVTGSLDVAVSGEEWGPKNIGMVWEVNVKGKNGDCGSLGQ